MHYWISSGKPCYTGPCFLELCKGPVIRKNASMAWRRHWKRRSGTDKIKGSNSEIITNVNIEDDDILPRNWCSGFTLMLYFKGIISPLGLHVFASHSLCTHHVCIPNKKSATCNEETMLYQLSTVSLYRQLKIFKWHSHAFVSSFHDKATSEIQK